MLSSDKPSPVSGSPETASEDVKLTKENSKSTGEKVSAATSPEVEEKEANERIVAA